MPRDPRRTWYACSGIRHRSTEIRMWHGNPHRLQGRCVVCHQWVRLTRDGYPHRHEDNQQTMNDAIDRASRRQELTLTAYVDRAVADLTQWWHLLICRVALMWQRWRRKT